MPHIHAPRKATETMEGAGVTVRRLMPVPQFMNFDPFVLWDHFTIDAGTGFPDHPHRGFEAITYMFEGRMQHTDNLGNQSTVTAGGVQRFTAGRGIVHSEMPGGDGKSSGIQLWINLPQSLKGLEPDYQQVDARDIPEHKIGKTVVRDIVGADSPVQLRTSVRYADIRLDAGTEFSEVINKDFRGLVYVVAGEITLAGHVLAAGTAIFMEDIGVLEVIAQQKSRFMLCFGLPHNEPIRQHGPFVD